MQEKLELFKNYKRTGDLCYRDELFYIYEPVVHKFCKNKFKSEDLVQEGYMGILYGIDTFDEGKSLSLDVYIYFSIRNKVLDYYNTQIAKDGRVGKYKLKEYYNLVLKKKLQEINYKPQNEEDVMTKEEYNEYLKLENFIHPISLDKDDHHELFSKNNLDVAYAIFMSDLKEILKPIESTIVNLLLEDSDVLHISKKLNIKLSTMYYIINAIRNKIKKYLYE